VGTKPTTAQSKAQRTQAHLSHRPRLLLRGQPRGARVHRIHVAERQRRCVVDVDYVRCDIDERDWSPPARPADCELDYGQRIARSPGKPAAFVCARDTALGGGKPLQYAESLPAGPMRYNSAESSITCRGVSDRRWLLDCATGLSAVLTSLGRPTARAWLRFVQLRLGGLSSSFATGDDVVSGARM
jgi:hypothetical protein